MRCVWTCLRHDLKPQPFGPSDIGSMIRRDQSVAGAFQLGLEASHLELGQLEENARLQGGQKCWKNSQAYGLNMSRELVPILFPSQNVHQLVEVIKCYKLTISLFAFDKTPKAFVDVPLFHPLPPLVSFPSPGFPMAIQPRSLMWLA